MTRRIHSAYGKLTRALLSRRCTVKDLAHVSGLSYDTVQRFVATLRTKPRQLRICEWGLDSMGRASIQVFELGTEPDAPRPKPKTSAERMQALKARQLARSFAELTNILNRPQHELGICNCTTDNQEAGADAPEAAVLRASDV